MTTSSAADLDNLLHRAYAQERQIHDLAAHTLCVSVRDLVPTATRVVLRAGGLGYVLDHVVTPSGPVHLPAPRWGLYSPRGPAASIPHHAAQHLRNIPPLDWDGDVPYVDIEKVLALVRTAQGDRAREVARQARAKVKRFKLHPGEQDLRIGRTQIDEDPERLWAADPHAFTLGVEGKTMWLDVRLIPLKRSSSLDTGLTVMVFAPDQDPGELAPGTGRVTTVGQVTVGDVSYTVTASYDED